METKLSELGFTINVNCEAIVSTLNPDDSPNAAPMGIQMQNESNFKLNLFNTSSTCHNLKAKKCGVVNLTHNIDFYYKAAFKEANPNGKIPADWFEMSQAVAAPKLRHADVTIEFTVESSWEGAQRTLFFCKVARINAKKQYSQVYCRAMPLTLEAIIHATRVKAFIEVAEKQEMVTQLIETIQEHALIVERVAPNSPYTAVFADLLRRIDQWRSNL
ncbi:MAG: DUF447 domain-containing protein [Candidatus Bathyarchaeia archaeon]|jgi:hypothetical protein